MLEFLFQLIGEVVLQGVLELLVDLGLEPFRRKRESPPPNPWFTAIAYACLGALAGGVSLWLLPELLVRDESWRVVNLIATPILAGFAMAALGVWRVKRGHVQVSIERFSYAYLFALCLALVRFHFAG